ncbi:ribonuclease HII [Planococcus liqunii]|uniref:Ribonuclease HII n=1 Tax=Planococcus liqunii TaxID=3058394 RepID=A0ABT8MM77_9BACL|nr:MULTISPECIES: ribonuclease HII [unclassified Planococcus (in: firmicutes)]MDN7225968.1 ribonuclease HII [Planococcus sp. N064]WKA49759.1 ribonuclease HII [Planococcus sp. N056]
MMKIGEVKERLAETVDWETWMDDIRQDPRKNVQAALAGWQRKKNLRDKQQHAHDQKIEFDASFKENREDLVCGIDEAGRGPLAGPVVTAAVILPEDCSVLTGLDDSKKLSKAKRDQYAALIKEIAVSYAVHIQPPEEIDAQNIYQATRSSMTQAALQLNPRPDVILADAMQLDAGIHCESIIKGDAKSLCIAAASILAKTGRDAIMAAYASEYPAYGFEKHAGYGTKEHLIALEENGPCPIHRKTFEPVKSMVEPPLSLRLDS